MNRISYISDHDTQLSCTSSNYKALCLRNKHRKMKTKDRAVYFRKVTPVRSKEPVLQEANSSLWKVRTDLLFFMDIIKLVPSTAIWEMHLFLEEYMRCDGRSIQDKTPEGADRRNIIILYNMPLSNIQRHSKVFTHSTLTPFSLVFQEKEKKKKPTPHTKTTTKKMKVVNGDESKPIIHSKNINSRICIPKEGKMSIRTVPTKFTL